MTQAIKLLLHASAVETVTGNSADFEGVTADGPGAVYVDCTAASGTSPTLDLVLEEKDPVSGKYFDTGLSFTQIVAAATERVALPQLNGMAYRLTWTIGGTTPSFTFSVSLVAKDRG